jgi:hypothetical protein
MGPRGGALVLGDCFAPATQVRRLCPSPEIAAAGAKNFANARAARNLFERTQQSQANRLAMTTVELTREDLMMIEVEDVRRSG